MLTRLHDYKKWLERNKRVVLCCATLTGVLLIGLWALPVSSQEDPGKKDTALFYKGQEFLEKKNPEAASEKFRELIDRYPKSNIRDLAYYWLGRSYLDLKKLPEAKQTLGSLKREFPASPLVKQLDGAVKTAKKNLPPPAPKEEGKENPPPSISSEPPPQETAQAPPQESPLPEVTVTPPPAPAPPSGPPSAPKEKGSKTKKKSKEEMRRDAIALYQKIIRDSPDSQEADKAKDRLKQMGVETGEKKLFIRDPVEVEFEKNLDVFNQEDYSASAGKFESFLSNYPDSSLRVKAEYYLAESYRLLEQEP